jgi:hypothetical protein
LEFCDEISGKSTTGGGDPMDRTHDGGMGMRSGDVTFPPSTHKPTSSINSSITMASNLMLKSCKDLTLGE